MIALVISIIVMLILAGVSINAIVGDNGVLTKTTYASFLSEMSAVEEAVQLWKAGEIIEAQGDEVKAIPANGLCKANDLTSAERLVGEVGYYRVWSLTSTMPTTDILSSADTFNSSFESELVFYPAGVQDLYYLNNEALEIKGNKTYLIDATTGMIYSMTGISLKGVRCYSLNMAKAVMNGTIEQPLFAEAEVSGTGNGEKLAGNVSTEYVDVNGNAVYKRADGKYVDAYGNIIDASLVKENEAYNPNGFQIIADFTNDNLYKLYNNGDLYGKGVKGIKLNTTSTLMSEIDVTIWQEFKIPNMIPGYDSNNIKLVSGNDTAFVIDSNKNVWAWGDNNSNKLGLTKEEQVQYTGMEPVKLNVEGKKVYKVFSNSSSTYIITLSDGVYELYAAGLNDNGQLGIGSEIITQNKFSKCTFEHPEKIINITNYFGNEKYTIILCSDGKMYFAGNTTDRNVNTIFKNTDKQSQVVSSFIEIFNNKYGAKFANQIVEIQRWYNWNNTRIFLLDSNKNLYDWNGEIKLLDTNVDKIFGAASNGVYLKTNESNHKEIYGFTTNYIENNIFGKTYPNQRWTNLNSNLGFDPDLIKDIYLANGSAIYYLLNNGKVYFSGSYSFSGTGIVTGMTLETICLQDESNLPLIETIDAIRDTGNCSSCPIFISKSDSNMYATRNQTLIFRDNILQRSWSLVASNVKKFKACTENGCIAYIDNNNDLYVAGNDSTMLGINDQNVNIINNFVRQKDYLQDLDIYDNISGKVEDYWICDNALFFKTNELDNNTVYVCGTSTLNTTWRGNNFLGLGKESDAFIPTKVADHINLFHAYGNARMYITESGELYTWGSGGWNFPMAQYNSYVPILTTWKGIDVSNVYKADFRHGRTYIWVKDNNQNLLYTQGLENDLYTFGFGIGNTSNDFILLDLKDEIIEATTVLNSNTDMILTKNNGLYGFGRKCVLGIGDISVELQRTPIKLLEVDEKICQIAAGNGYCVALTADGRVYGTGTNKFGILGRWIGIDRNTPNSRYKTAFEWVECPELEI